MGTPVGYRDRDVIKGAILASKKVFILGRCAKMLGDLKVNNIKSINKTGYY